MTERPDADLYQKASRKVFDQLLAEHGLDVQRKVTDFVRQVLLDRGAEDAPYTVALAARILMITARTLLQQTVKDPDGLYMDWAKELNEFFHDKIPERKVRGALEFPSDGN